MNWIFFILSLLLFVFPARVHAQDSTGKTGRLPLADPGSIEEEAIRLENLAERNQADITDDAREIDLSILRKHPLNLNRADEDELKMLPEITAGRISSLLLTAGSSAA